MIRLPYATNTPYLHDNQRLARQEKAKRIAKVRRDVGYLALSQHLGKGHEHITVGLTWRPEVVRNRDGNENLAPLVKACVDGLVGVGVVADDTDEQVTRTRPVLLPPDKRSAGMWLIVDIP